MNLNKAAFILCVPAFGISVAGLANNYSSSWWAMLTMINGFGVAANYLVITNQWDN